MRTVEPLARNSEKLLNTKVKEIVTGNFHTATLFEKYGIDYCCNGNRLLGDVLKEKNIGEDEIHQQIDNFKKTEDENTVNYSQMDLDRLAQHIVSKHHAYVRESIPRIKEHLAKVIGAHGDKYPYLADVGSAFIFIAEDLVSHMMKEEKILFPLIHYLMETKRVNERPKTSGYGTIKNPIRRMEEEHLAAGEMLYKIRDLTKDYALPKDACTTFKITYEELKEFELDLHQHIHLENNILFPRAIELEEQLLKN